MLTEDTKKNISENFWKFLCGENFLKSSLCSWEACANSLLRGNSRKLFLTSTVWRQTFAFERCQLVFSSIINNASSPQKFRVSTQNSQTQCHHRQPMNERYFLRLMCVLVKMSVLEKPNALHVNVTLSYFRFRHILSPIPTKCADVSSLKLFVKIHMSPLSHI